MVSISKYRGTTRYRYGTSNVSKYRFVTLLLEISIICFPNIIGCFNKQDLQRKYRLSSFECLFWHRRVSNTLRYRPGFIMDALIQTILLSCRVAYAKHTDIGVLVELAKKYARGMTFLVTRRVDSSMSDAIDTRKSLCYSTANKTSRQAPAKTSRRAHAVLLTDSNRQKC